MDDELERLRARAYGPDADISDDPAAMRRLAELEAQRREAPTAGAADGASADAATGSGDREDAAGESAPQEPAVAESAPARADAARPPSRIARWLPALWALSLLVVAAVAAAMTFTTTAGLLQAVPQGDARQIATVELGSNILAPRYLGLEQRADSRGHRDWYGLTILVVRGTWYGDTEDECLVIMRRADVDPNAESLSGPVFTGCSAGGLPAMLQLRVNSAMPDELLEQFPAGTGLRFVLDGSRVGVFVANE